MFRRNSSKNKHRRPLGRSKSMNTIVRNPVHELEFIDPRLAERDANIAARLSYYRAHGRGSVQPAAMPRQPASQGLSRSDSIVSGHSTVQKRSETRQSDGVVEAGGLQRQQSVRFTGSHARPRRTLAARAMENPLQPCHRVETYSASSITGHDRMPFEEIAFNSSQGPPEYYAVEDDMASIQSSYRKLRKSKSLFNSSNMIRSEYSFGTAPDQPKQWRPSRYASLNKENEPTKPAENPSLKAPKSMSFLGSRREEQSSRVSSRAEIDPAVQLAREKFRQQMEQKKLKSQPSLFFRSKYKRSESSVGLRKSLRHSSNTSTVVSSAFSGDTVLIQKPTGLRRTARKVSNSLKNKIKGLFGRSKSGENSDYVNDKSGDSDGESCLAYKGETGGPDEASISQVNSHVPSLHAVPSNQQMHSRQGSMESLVGDDAPATDDKSRVTSWTNSTADTLGASSVVGEWEGQRLSVIQETGMTLSTVRANIVSPPTLMAAPSAIVSSERVYSALMKRLEETKRSEQLREKSVEDYKELGIAPPRGSSADRVSFQDWEPPTIRCVRADDDVFEENSSEALAQRQDSPKLLPEQSVKDDLDKQSDKDACQETCSPVKSSSVRAEVRQPRTLSQRSSAFFASPTCHLFRTTSPYRRALRENIKAAQPFQSNRHDFDYLKSLSSLNLPLRPSSTTVSEREVLAGGAESVYSYDMDNGRGAMKDGALLVDSFPQPPTSQAHGDVTIFMDKPVARPVKTPVRDFSTASSVEWKTWLSSRVSRLEGSTIEMQGDTLKQLTAPGHVRENAEIDSPGQALEPRNKVVGAGPLKPVEGNRVAASPNQTQKLGPTVLNTDDENAAPGSKCNMQKWQPNMSVEPLSSTGENNLQRNHWERDGGAWNAHASIGPSPHTREEKLRRRRAHMGTGRGSVSPAKSSPGLSMAVQNQFGKVASGSPRSRLDWRGQRSVPSLRNEALQSEGMHDTSLLEPERVAQAMGSRKMVDMFLSSRRGMVDRRSGTGSEGSPSMFL